MAGGFTAIATQRETLSCIILRWGRKVKGFGRFWQEKAPDVRGRVGFGGVSMAGFENDDRRILMT